MGGRWNSTKTQEIRTTETRYVRGSSMESYWSGIVNQLFRIDPRIRYVGIGDMQYRVMASEMRPGMSSLTTTETDRTFVSMVPRVMVDGAQQLASAYGPMEILTVRYRKVLLAIYNADQHIVMLSYDPSVETPFTEALVRELKRVFQYDKASS